MIYQDNIVPNHSFFIGKGKLIINNIKSRV